MSSTNPNDSGRTKIPHLRRRPPPGQVAVTTNPQPRGAEPSFSYDNEAFPTIQAASSTSTKTKPTTSTIRDEPFDTQNVHPRHTPQTTTHNIPQLMPSTELTSQHDIEKKPSSRKNSTSTVPKQSLMTSGPKSSLAATRSDIVTDNDPTIVPARPLSARENEINRKLCEIILTIHESKEYVSRERVQQELFNYFRVNSWRDLGGTHPSRFNALMNLTDRQKGITFYMQVFEQVFNLCTLNDLEPYLAKFLKVDKYQDLRLGPLEKNPDVQRIFKYRPTDSDQPIPTITTGDVIKEFMKFQREHRHQRNTPFEEFLEKLVKVYELQSCEELGVFCKSFPYLVQVAGTVRRDLDYHAHQVKEQAQKQLTEDVRTRLSELKEEIHDEQQLAAFNQKKTPTAVFNYLTSIVDKYLDIVPEQPALYAILIQLREDDLLQCLFNMAIYLGTIDKPEVFIEELKQLYSDRATNSQKQGSAMTQQLSILSENLSKKDRKKLNAMIQQREAQEKSSSIKTNEQNTTSSTPVSTSFTSSLLTSQSNKPKPPIPFKQFCSDIYGHLIRFDTVLTIEQLLEVDGELCAQYNVPNFSAFNYDENNSDDNPINLVSFLNKHRENIDPHGELFAYDHTASMGDQTEVYSFIEQLSAIHNDEMKEDNHQQSIELIHGHASAGQLHLSADKLSAVEKAIKHKFGRSTRKVNHLIKKTKHRHRKHKSSIIRFEESLLDVNGLNKLDICPSSLNVNETQLCQLILHCPLMTELHTWFQWSYFFQPKYGTLKSFLARHEDEFKNLRILETLNQELFRLPLEATLNSFEQELNAMRIPSAVGHLCALIIQEGLVTRFSFNVYQTSMIAWFHHLRSLNTLHSADQIDPMQYILDFLMTLPVLIGQSRIVEELVLRPLDDVFSNDRENGISARTRSWNLADIKQKTKLELWGHIFNVVEWKNESKWLGLEDSQEPLITKPKNEILQQQNIYTVTPVVPTTTTIESSPVSTSNVTATPITTSTTYTDDTDDSTETAFKHIETIRHGFGVDSSLDSNGKAIVANLQGMVERSLNKLSMDLYSDEGHFVLELIQNADDNQYAPDLLPTLRFVLAPERILVCNNEIGFQPSNISAICNVGASTKGKHKQGYAGHKGIGFKSVFMVSNKPEIHSRSYHIRFDTDDGAQWIGYIRPIWLDQYEEELPNANEWTTCIRLPIKVETRRDQLRQNFDDIQARILLFLNRLRQIEVINQSSISSPFSNTRVFTRIDHAQGQIIELQEKNNDKSSINNFWLVIKQVIEVPEHIKIKLRDIKGEVDSTTIAIAYPLGGIQESSNQLPPTQPLFAYLPLRSYGFRFILQADFEIPATRQEIRRDNLWNDWLKSEMTCLLALAYRQFQRLPELFASSSIDTQINTHLTPIQTIKYFLKLIPSRSELDLYFNTFVDKSIQLLTDIIKLPVSRQNEKNETIIDWVLPSQCIIVQDSFIRKILSQDLLLSHFNCYYVHEQLALECDEQILLKLGCRSLDFKDITRLIEASYKQNEQQHPKTAATIEQIAQWLVCLDYSLQQQRDEIHYSTQEKDTITKLKQMKIIPLKQQSYLVSIDEFEAQTILFPLNKATQYSKHLRIVLDDIPTLDEQLLNFIEDKHPRRMESIKRLLQKLGMRDTPNIRDIYRQHMLPVMLDPSRCALKSEPILIAYVLCIYQYIYLSFRDAFNNDLKTLQKALVIKTRDNKFVSLGSADVIVHLTSTYGTRISLDSLKLSKSKFTFISDDYYTQFRTNIGTQESDVYEFMRFFEELNVRDFLLMNSVDTPFINVSQLADTQWAYLSRSLVEMIHEPFIIQDYRCEEFIKLVSSTDENQAADSELCVQLLQYLDRNHSNVARHYAATVMLARAHNYGNATPIKAVESSFCQSLRQFTWIPVTGGILCKPNDVYLLPQNSETYPFRQYVPHLDVLKVTLRNEDFIYNTLGIKPQVKHQTMFELLMKWSCDLDSESLWTLVQETNTLDSIPCTLSSTFHQTCLDTIDNFCHIYHFLASNDETRSLLNRFRLWPLIFIPRDQKTGDFVFGHQTFWNDPIALLSSQDAVTDSKGRIPIHSYYDRSTILQKFFIEILQVESQPTIDDYLPLLSTVQDIDKLWQIIEIITKLVVEQNKQQEVREKCRNIAFIPCMDLKQKQVKYSDRPFYPDNTDIANLFADTLSIIKLPKSNLSPEFKEHFCLLFNIENLNKVIQTRVDVTNEEPSKSLADFYRSSIDLIQNFLLNKKLISDDQSKYFSTIFARMQFICVNHIQISYCYGTTIVKEAPTSSNIDTYIDEQTCKFYILKKYETSEMRYTDGMVNFLVQDKGFQSELLSYIKTILQIYQKDDAQGLGKLHEASIDNYEPKWIIPEEIKKEVPEVLLSIQENKKENTTSQKPTINPEDIQKLMEVDALRPKIQRKVKTEEDAIGITSFPAKAGGIESDTPIIKDPSKVKPDDSNEKEHTPSSSTSTSHDQNHQVFKDREQTDHDHVVPKDRTDRSTNSNSVNGVNNESNEDQLVQLHPPIAFTDPILLPPPRFEHVVVSNLTNFDLSTSAPSIDDESIPSNPFRPISSEADRITGRQGEQFVFQYLQWKYPKETITWINKEDESGKPYDIHMAVKSENNREEFIEVKTTRAFDQNTFPVSIGEVEYLLKHPTNYFIYRVYYADNQESSTITVINKIKDNLQLKHLKLSMTVISKSSD